MEELQFQQQREAAAVPLTTDSAAAAYPQAAAVFSSPNKPTFAAGGGEGTATTTICGTGAGTSAAPLSPTARAAAPRAGDATGSATGGPGFQEAVARSTLYGALSAMCLLMALVCLLLPGMTAKAMFGSAAEPLEDQHYHLFQMNGGALLVAAGAAAALALTPSGEAEGTAEAALAPAASGWGRMSPRGADLLKLALAGQGLANVLLFVYYGATITALVWPIELLTNGATLALPLMDLLASNGHRGILTELQNRLTTMRPGSLLAGAHMLLAFLFPAAGATLFYAPRFSLYHLFGYSYGKSTFLLAKIAGVADKSLITVIQLVLKEAAGRGALGTHAARLMNVGMLLSGLVHMRVLLPILAMGHGGFMLPVVIATWAMATLTSAADLLAGGRVGERASAVKEDVAEVASKNE